MSGTADYPAGYPLEQERQFFYGKYRGVVSTVDADTWRIKARVPAVLGDTDTGWCMPCVPYAGPQRGIAFLPEPGSGVWIEFEGGDVSYPIWVGCYWRDGELPPGIAADVKVIVTAAEHRLVFNDAEKRITISDPSGGLVILDSSGITVGKGTMQVLVSDTSVSVNDGALEVQ